MWKCTLIQSEGYSLYTQISVCECNSCNTTGPAPRLSTKPVLMFSCTYMCATGKPKSLLALQTVTEGGIKFMTRILPELNLMWPTPLLLLIGDVSRGPMVDSYPIWQCTAQQNHSSRVFIVCCFLAHITGSTKTSMDITETSVNS